MNNYTLKEILDSVTTGEPMKLTNHTVTSQYDFPKVVGGWKLVRVATMGRGNGGHVVALPLTPNNVRIWRNAKVEQLTALGLTATEAFNFIELTAPYKWEPEVLVAIVWLKRNAYVALGAFKESESPRKWMREWEISPFELTMPRMWTAISIAKQI